MSRAMHRDSDSSSLAAEVQWSEARQDQPRPYRAPCLRPLGAAQDLLELLGPAQASYGDVMGP
jgi:hypothetical protein